MKPAHKFHLDLGRHFFVVEIYPTEQGMQDGIAAIRGARCADDKNARAVTLCYHAHGRNEKRKLVPTGELGTLFFHTGDMTPNVVVHELTHAALYWSRRLRLNPNGRQEERFVTTLQTMFEDFYLHLNRQINEQKKAA